MKTFYFGCVERPGHFLYKRYPDGEIAQAYHRDKDVLPFGDYILDGALLPQTTDEVEGLARVAHIGGWTILSFWDRSVDKRGKCNSNFLFEGSYGCKEAIDLAKELYPAIFARFKFEVNIDPAFNGAVDESFR